jgi:hypothetical protein
MRMRVHRSSSAALTSELAPRVICLEDPFIAALIGVKKLRAVGKKMEACQSFPTTPCRVLIGTLFRRRRRWVSLTYAMAFSGGRCTVCLMPSNLNPIMSFLDSKFPSPLSNLLSEIGSLPP